MGSTFNTPGFVKFWWMNDIVETKYPTIHEIPIITLDKREVMLSKSNETVAIVHFDDSKQSLEYQNLLKQVPGLKVYAIPSQNSKQNFETIGINNPESLGKMQINGSHTHPLFKYLKKNCDTFYSSNTSSSTRTLSAPIGMFVVEQSLNPENCRVSYYSEQKIQDFLQKQKIK